MQALTETNKVFATMPVSITVQKEWKAPNKTDQVPDGVTIPDSIQVNVMSQKGTQGKTLVKQVELTKEEGWQASIKDLPAYDGSVKLHYSIEEAPLAGWVSSQRIDNGKVIITNAVEVPKISINVSKAWADGKGNSPNHPEVEVALLANGENTGKTIKLNEGNAWKASFDDLDKIKQDGTAIEYSVEEVNVPKYFTAEVSGGAEDGFVVTNTFTIPTKDVSVTKVWEDNGYTVAHKEVTVELLANKKPTGKTIKLNEANAWKASFENLPAIDSTANVIVYSISEAKVENYSATISGNMNDGFTITNSFENPSTEVSGTKTWEDANNQDGKRPDEIIVHLLANGKETGKSAIVNADSAWKYVFANLNIFAKDGSKYVYSVIEDAVEGYTSSVDGFDITNIHNPEKVSVSVSKNWVGPAKDKAEINLLADNKVVASVVLNNENNWQHTFSDLDKYKQGKEITYKVKEVPVEGYTSSVSGSAKDGFSVTNTIIIPKISINVSKAWADGKGNTPNHPEVEVALLANGENTGKTIKLNEGNAWKASFDDLDKIKQDGTAIEYSVEEVNVPEHFTAEVNGTAKDGFVVTNTYKPIKEEPEKQKPADKDEPTSNKKDTSKKVIPAAGDNNPAPYVMFLAISALGVLVVGRKFA